MQLLHGGQYFVCLHRQEVAGILQDPVPLVHLLSCPSAAQKFHPAAALVMYETDNLDGPHHARIRRMGAAAGTDIPVFDVHQPHGTPQFFVFLPQRVFAQFRGIHIVQGNGFIGPEAFIGHLFRLFGSRFIDFLIQVDEHAVFIHMEAHVVGPAGLPEGVGQDVFPTVLLHPVQPHGPVQFHLDLLSRFHRCPGPVVYICSCLGGIEHRHCIQPALIGQLSAPFREDHCLVQCHFIMVVLLFAGQYLGFTGLQQRIIFIQFSGHRNHLVLQSVLLSASY